MSKNPPTAYPVAGYESDYPPVIIASAPTTHEGTYVIPPNSYQPHTFHAQNVQPVARREPPTGYWADGICEWSKNLYPSCYCACCFFDGMYINAQMAHKLNLIPFQRTIWITLLVWLFSLILQIIFDIGIIIWIPLIFSICYGLNLRFRIIQHYNLNQTNTFVEFLTGIFCYPCSVAQMARQVYGYTKVLDGDADPDRLDHYNV